MNTASDIDWSSVPQAFLGGAVCYIDNSIYIQKHLRIEYVSEEDRSDVEILIDNVWYDLPDVLSGWSTGRLSDDEKSRAQNLRYLYENS